MLGALVATSSCQLSTAEQVGEDRAALVDGDDLSLDRNVGVLRHPGSAPTAFHCSATLIGRRSVLTTAQCALNGAVMDFCDYPCGNVNNCSATCVSGTMHWHPQYDGSADHDVAVVLLAQDFTSLTGIFPNRLGGPPSEGDVIEMVGYGCTSPVTGAGKGQKRGGINNVDELNDELIDYSDDSQTFPCDGDAGSPLLLPGTDCEVGINSHVDGRFFDPDFQASRADTKPRLDEGIFGPDFQASRVDTKLSWIRSTAGDPSVNACGQTTCGDNLCVSPENCSTCPQDCGACPVCGDGVCSSNESCFACPGDCGACPPYCGDGICNGNEDIETCLVDCQVECPAGKVNCCGDGKCLPLTTCHHVVCGG